MSSLVYAGTILVQPPLICFQFWLILTVYGFLWITANFIRFEIPVCKFPIRFQRFWLIENTLVLGLGRLQGVWCRLFSSYSNILLFLPPDIINILITIYFYSENQNTHQATSLKVCFDIPMHIIIKICGYRIQQKYFYYPQCDSQCHKQLRKQKHMEYKYKMLNPPHSTQSIDFKLSETYLENCVLLSPVKAQDSLTYTVSMETIQDHESPFKGLSHHLFHIGQRSHQLESHSHEKTNEPYNLNSHQPIISIRIQPEGIESLSLIEQKEAIQISLHQEKEQKNQPSFAKKNVVHITNLKLQTISEEQTDRKCIKMGKVMTRIHSQIKQNRSITRSRIASRKTLQSPNHESIQSQGKTHSQKKQSTEKRYQNADKINENHMFSQGFSQIKGSESKLSKTNASSNEPYSPEIIRRKSDYCSSKIENEINCKSKPSFLTERSPEGKRLVNLKTKNPTSRERIYSAFSRRQKPQCDSLTISSKVQQKYNMWKNPRQPSISLKQTDKAKILDKLKQNQVHLTSSILISSLKPNLTDRSKQNISKYMHKKIISNFMVDENSANSIDISKQGGFSPKKQKQVELMLNKVQINTSIAVKGIHCKKVWRKMKENFPKRAFCV